MPNIKLSKESHEMILGILNTERERCHSSGNMLRVNEVSQLLRDFQAVTPEVKKEKIMEKER